ncbi:hypothetical protein FC695_35680, partial [Bacillus cereus]
MERQYYVRGKKVQIKELTDIIAVKPVEQNRNLNEGLKQATVFLDSRETTNTEEQQAFQNAGWYFINPNEEISRSFNRSSEEIAIGRVFKQENGRMLIGNNLLTVQIDPNLNEQESLALLSENNLEIINKLGFGKHLYEVKVPADLDFLEVANKLNERSEFLFAEPQFIEQISSRNRPTDPDYSKQWQWKNDGSNGGVVNADVHAEEAWDIAKGDGIRI